jgi:acetyltransferase-like isoleucine patch superfamily enzyme
VKKGGDSSCAAHAALRGFLFHRVRPGHALVLGSLRRRLGCRPARPPPSVAAGASVGADCTLGKGAYVGTGAVIGDRVKVGNYACVFGASVADEAMICPGAMILEDPAPRATNPDGSRKGSSDWTPRPVTIGLGATIGAGAIIAPGVAIGPGAMVAIGAVVTRDVAAYALVAGHPARPVGWACACGTTLDADLRCPSCGRAYEHGEQGLAAILGKGEPT